MTERITAYFNAYRPRDELLAQLDAAYTEQQRTAEPIRFDVAQPPVPPRRKWWVALAASLLVVLLVAGALWVWQNGRQVVQPSPSVPPTPTLVPSPSPSPTPDPYAVAPLSAFIAQPYADLLMQKRQAVVDQYGALNPTGVRGLETAERLDERLLLSFEDNEALPDFGSFYTKSDRLALLRGDFALLFAHPEANTQTAFYDAMRRMGARMTAYMSFQCGDYVIQADTDSQHSLADLDAPLTQLTVCYAPVDNSYGDISGEEYRFPTYVEARSREQGIAYATANESAFETRIGRSVGTSINADVSTYLSLAPTVRFDYYVPLSHPDSQFSLAIGTKPGQMIPAAFDELHYFYGTSIIDWAVGDDHTLYFLQQDLSYDDEEETTAARFLYLDVFTDGAFDRRIDLSAYRADYTFEYGSIELEGQTLTILQPPTYHASGGAGQTAHEEAGKKLVIDLSADDAVEATTIPPLTEDSPPDEEPAPLDALSSLQPDFDVLSDYQGQPCVSFQHGWYGTQILNGHLVSQSELSSALLLDTSRVDQLCSLYAVSQTTFLGVDDAGRLYFAIEVAEGGTNGWSPNPCYLARLDLSTQRVDSMRIFDEAVGLDYEDSYQFNDLRMTRDGTVWLLLSNSELDVLVQRFTFPE